MKKHYIAPIFPTVSQKMRLERKVRYAQGMLRLRSIHHEIRLKKAELIKNEEFINSIAQ